MPTRLLDLPLVTIACRTKTNESWRDGVAFATAGSIEAYRNPANAGLGMPTDLTVQPGVFIGNYTITFADAATFTLTDPDGYTVGAGLVFVPFSAGGITFSLDPGVTAFAEGDTIILVVLPQPLDITGIRFTMQMRRAAGQPFVLLSADTEDQTLINGGATGVLGFNIPFGTMAEIATSPEGSPHVFDILARADGDRRCCVDGTNTVVAGITVPAN